MAVDELRLFPAHRADSNWRGRFHAAIVRLQTAVHASIPFPTGCNMAHHVGYNRPYKFPHTRVRGAPWSASLRDIDRTNVNWRR
jgi:hypothetical protein